MFASPPWASFALVSAVAGARFRDGVAQARPATTTQTQQPQNKPAARICLLRYIRIPPEESIVGTESGPGNGRTRWTRYYRTCRRRLWEGTPGGIGPGRFSQPP